MRLNVRGAKLHAPDGAVCAFSNACVQGQYLEQYLPCSGATYGGHMILTLTRTLTGHGTIRMPHVTTLCTRMRACSCARTYERLCMHVCIYECARRCDSCRNTSDCPLCAHACRVLHTDQAVLVCVCVCVCLYVCIPLYIYIYIYVYVYIYVYICDIYVHINTNLHTYTYARAHVHTLMTSAPSYIHITYT